MNMKSERDKKDGRYLNCYLDRNVYERLEQHCRRSGQTKTAAIERAIEEFTFTDEELCAAEAELKAKAKARAMRDDQEVGEAQAERF